MTGLAEAGPIRTCIGCRGRAPAADLVRTVAVTDPDGTVTVVLDERRRLPGRGAWLHPRAQCLAAARKRGAFRRALRVAGGLSDTAVDLP